MPSLNSLEKIPSNYEEYSNFIANYPAAYDGSVVLSINGNALRFEMTTENVFDTWMDWLETTRFLGKDEVYTVDYHNENDIELSIQFNQEKSKVIVNNHEIQLFTMDFTTYRQAVFEGYIAFFSQDCFNFEDNNMSHILNNEIVYLYRAKSMYEALIDYLNDEPTFLFTNHKYRGEYYERLLDICFRESDSFEFIIFENDVEITYKNAFDPLRLEKYFEEFLLPLEPFIRSKNKVSRNLFNEYLFGSSMQVFEYNTHPDALTILKRFTDRSNEWGRRSYPQYLTFFKNNKAILAFIPEMYGVYIYPDGESSLYPLLKDSANWEREQSFFD